MPDEEDVIRDDNTPIILTEDDLGEEDVVVVDVPEEIADGVYVDEEEDEDDLDFEADEEASF